MREATAALLVLSALLAAAPARAQSALTGAQTLARPLGARATALGQAFVAVDGGLDSLGYNPAGLSTATRPALQTSYERGIADDLFTYAAYAQPLGLATLAVGGEYYDAGSIRLQLSDGTDKVVHAEQDYVEQLGLGVPLGPSLAAGAVAKVYQLNLAQTADAQGFAFDGGLLWRTPVPGLNAGASFSNLGQPVKFEVQSDPLPTTYRAGLSYLFDIEQHGYGKGDSSYVFTKYRLNADAIAVDKESIAAGTGLEMDMPFGKTGHAVVRAGYLFNRDLQGFTAGIGFREGRVIFDYGLGVVQALSDQHRFTIGLVF